MKKLILTESERKRIELKFECIKRNDDYIKDYKSQQEYKRQHDSYEKLEPFLYSKWLHFPLLDPSVPIEHYKKKNNYSYWLEKTLVGLITSDPLCPQVVKVESPEIKKYLSWKKKGYKTLVQVKKGKIINIPFPEGSAIYDELDAEQIKSELRKLRLSLDLKGFATSEIKQHIEQLLKELKPLVERFLNKDSKSIRPTVVMEYLNTFDRKQRLSYRKMSDDEGQIRKFKKQLRNAKILIKGGWRSI